MELSAILLMAYFMFNFFLIGYAWGSRLLSIRDNVSFNIVFVFLIFLFGAAGYSIHLLVDWIKYLKRK